MASLTPRKDAAHLRIEAVRKNLDAEPSDDYCTEKSRRMALALAEALLPDVAHMFDLNIPAAEVLATAAGALGTFLANLSVELDPSDPPTAMTAVAVRMQIGAVSCFRDGPDCTAPAPVPDRPAHDRAQ